MGYTFNDTELPLLSNVLTLLAKCYDSRLLSITTSTKSHALMLSSICMDTINLSIGVFFGYLFASSQAIWPAITALPITLTLRGHGWKWVSNLGDPGELSSSILKGSTTLIGQIPIISGFCITFSWMKSMLIAPPSVRSGMPIQSQEKGMIKVHMSVASIHQAHAEANKGLKGKSRSTSYRQTFRKEGETEKGLHGHPRALDFLIAHIVFLPYGVDMPSLDEDSDAILDTQLKGFNLIIQWVKKQLPKGKGKHKAETDSSAEDIHDLDPEEAGPSHAGPSTSMTPDTIDLTNGPMDVTAPSDELPLLPAPPLTLPLTPIQTHTQLAPSSSFTIDTSLTNPWKVHTTEEVHMACGPGWGRSAQDSKHTHQAVRWLTTSRRDSWQDIITHWLISNPPHSLSIPLKNWPADWHQGHNCTFASKYSQQAMITLEFIDIFKSDKACFLTAYPEAEEGHTHLLHDINKAQLKHQQLESQA
ncbi:hypothetical protein BKA82DRAFT_4013198 [Pisolithus tinctorius]|nr:hypothetical protein BKA82DRAFT_4013198 [Pisolithus tinctorius]